MNEPMNDVERALPPMIDTHCHLDDHQFAADLQDVLERSRDAGVTRWVLIGYDPNRWNEATRLSGITPGMFHTLGVHPSCAQQWNDGVAQSLRSGLIETGAVAIGEAGLDFYRDNAPYDVQAPVFIDQLELARELSLPLIIHMRSAEDDLIKLLKAQPALPTLIFHSFDGSNALMDFALETDSYVGIGGLATRQKSEELRAILKRVPHNRMLLETDSPYLVPARQKDRRNQPAHVATIAGMMADYFEMSAADLARQTTSNAERVFGLNHD